MMCDIKEVKFDDLKADYKLCGTWVLKELIDDKEYTEVKRTGFYPCKEYLLLDLEYLEECGLLMALPPESLHLILLGLVQFFIQGLSSTEGCAI